MGRALWLWANLYPSVIDTCLYPYAIHRVKTFVRDERNSMYPLAPVLQKRDPGAPRRSSGAGAPSSCESTILRAGQLCILSILASVAGLLSMIHD